MITELGKKCLFPSHHCLIFLLLLFLLSSAFPLFIWLYQRGYPHGTALNVFYLWFWLELTVLFWSFLMIFFFSSRSISKPLITLVWPAGCFHSTSSPIHFFLAWVPTSLALTLLHQFFLSFSLFFLFLFCYFSLLSIWWTCLSSFSEEVQEEVKDTRKKPQASHFPSSCFFFFVYFVE